MSPTQKRRRISLLGAILVLFVGGLVCWWNWATKPYSSSGSSERIMITSGMTADQLSEELQERKLIRSAWVFRYLVHSQQVQFKLDAGSGYQLAPTMSPAEIIADLLKGPDFTENDRLTIPEGYTTEQIIDLLVQKGIGTKEECTRVIMDDSFPYSFLQGAPKGIHRLEGFLFPDTYYINKNTTPHAAINMLLQRFAKEVTPDVQKQLDQKNLSVSQWVTIASLVEKEAAKASDRPLIASVIMNRLKIHMRLQIDATIQFLLSTPKSQLSKKDLSIPSAYNTYLHTGLPPGPIANPGDASLQAALHPAKTDYFYYVAKKDGYHVFAKTYAEHLKNIKLYE